MFWLAFLCFCSRFRAHFHVSAHIFMFPFAFSHFGSRFHVSARIFTFWLAFSRFSLRCHVSAHQAPPQPIRPIGPVRPIGPIRPVRLISHFDVACVFTLRLTFSHYSTHFHILACI